MNAAIQEQQEAAPQTTTVGGKGKKGKQASGNFLMDTAAEVETLTHPKALAMADTLAESIEENYFKLGGVLKLISDNSWFDGYPDFGSFVMDRYGFQSRKAQYLMQIYTDLVTKQIDWLKVKDLGWTKLKDLAPLLTPDNVDDWVAKVKNLTYVEMMAMIKGQTQNASDQSNKATSDSHPFKLMLKGDQLEIVNTALAKAKGELSTEYDSVALENICAGYVAGTVGSPHVSPKDLFLKMGWQEVLGLFGELFPTVDIVVTPPAE